MSGLHLDPSRNGTTWDFDTMPSIDNSSLITMKQTRRRKSHTKRSAHACSRCRTRKVRCDVSIRGHPCSNCNWEEVHCADPSPRTNRKKKSKCDATGLRETKIFDSRDILPPMFSPLPTTLSGEDINYLKNKDALSIPHHQLHAKLFKNYITSVHPHLPILDVRHFAEVLSNRETEKKVSLLLFQAVMLAGCVSVDLQHLREAGFQTRTEAQNIFFSRVKLLYDFDVETNSLDTIQALLLMAQCRPSLVVSGTKDRWHWLGLAISLAYRINLHRSFSHCMPASESGYEDNHLRHRIWWSCFMLDRLVALMDSKPTRIQKENCSTELLRLEDFDVETSISSVDKTTNESYGEGLRDMADMYMAKLLICWSFDDRTPHQFAVAQKQSYEMENTPSSIPTNSDASAIGNDYWEDEERGCNSSYTNSTAAESVATCNAVDCLNDPWTPKFNVEGYTEHLVLQGENEFVESKPQDDIIDLEIE